MLSMWAQQISGLQRSAAENSKMRKMGKLAAESYQDGLRLRRDIADYIATRPDTGVMTREVAKEFGITQQSARGHLSRLHHDGVVTRATNQAPWRIKQ